MYGVCVTSGLNWFRNFIPDRVHFQAQKRIK